MPGDKPWRPDEDEKLRKLMDAKASITLMSARLRRSAGAIRKRIRALQTNRLPK
jgi:hypothetical protein